MPLLMKEQYPLDRPVALTIAERGMFWSRGRISSVKIWGSFLSADLLASAILKRKPSKIIRAWRLIPKGIQPGLKPVRYRGLVEIDPVSTDFYKFLVEDRYRWKAKEHADPDAKWLAAGEKILNNALSYGVKMEFNPQAKPGLSRITAGACWYSWLNSKHQSTSGGRTPFSGSRGLSRAPRPCSDGLI